MCKKQTSVSQSSTESEIISWMVDCAWMGLPPPDLWDIAIEVLRSTNNTARHGKQAQGDLCRTGDVPSITTRPKHQLKRESERLSNCHMWITYPPTHIVLKVNLSCTFLKSTKLSSSWLSKDEVQQWDTCLEPTELRLIGCSTESTWTPKSKSNMLIPKTNLLTF